MSKGKNNVVPGAELFHQLAEELPCMVAVYQDEKIVYVNRQVETITGYSRKDLSSGKLSYLDLMDAQSRGHAIENSRKVAAGLTVPPADYRFTTRQGRALDVVVSVALIQYDGRPAILGIMTDITAQKHLMKELTAQRDQVRQFLDVSSVIMIAIDPQGHVLMINRTGAEVLGYRQSEILGLNWFDTFIPQAARKDVKEVFADVISGKIAQSEYHENTVVARDGKEILVAWHNTICRDRDGKVTFSLSSGVDITHERRLIQELRQSEERFRDLFENTPVGLLRCTPDGILRTANKRLAWILGYENQESLTGLSLEKIFHADTPAARFLEHVERFGMVRGTDARLNRADGTSIWVRVTSRAVRGETGKTLHYETSVEDITRQKEAERKLARQSEFERILTRLATTFVKARPDATDAALAEAVETLTRFMGGDRGYISESVTAPGLFRLQVEWTSVGMEPKSATIRRTDEAGLPWLFGEIKQGKVVCVGRLDELPQAASVDKETLAAQAIKSIVLIPLIAPHGVAGVFGVESVRQERNWSQEPIEALNLAGEVLAGSMGRRYYEMALQRRLALYALITTASIRLGDVTMTSIDGVMRDIMSDLGRNLDLTGVCFLRTIKDDEPASRQHYMWESSPEPRGECPLRTLLDAKSSRDRLDAGEMMCVSPNAEVLPGSKNSQCHAVAIPFVSNAGSHAYLALCSDRPLQPRMSEEILSVVRIFGEMCQRSLEKRDVTQTMVTEHRLLDTLMQATPDHIYFKDEKSRFIRLSTAQARRFGLKNAYDSVGKTDYDFFSDEHANHAMADERRIMETGEPVIGKEEKETWPDGLETWVSTTKAALKDESGRIIGTFGISRDITERKKSEEARAGIEQKMQQVQKLESLGTLAGGIAHDFNNLLMGILGNTELALMDMTPESPAWSRVKQIEMAALRASELTGQMLAYGGKLAGTLMPLDINKLVHEMARFLEVSIPKHVKIHHRFEEQLPLIDGDGAQIRQVVMNLITNAADAIGDKDGSITIATGCGNFSPGQLADCLFSDEVRPGEYVFFEVIDTGSGMSKEVQQRIFDPFFTTKKTGHGLGLAAVMGIVKAHGGTVWLQSQIGVGTTFRVLLPRGSGKAAAQPTPASAAASSARGEGDIIVLDDDDVTRSVLQQVLVRFGYTAHVAHDDVSLRKLLDGLTVKVPLAIVDVMIGGRPCMPCLGILRERFPDICLILTSGMDEATALRSLNNCPHKGFMQKPFEIRVLADVIREALKPA